MEMNEAVWGGLPSELVERVLPFLPVLDLCRLRAVCRRWNELLCSASFHDECERSRSENGYLFLTRNHDDDEWGGIDPNFKRTMCLLDMDSRRWYSLKSDVEAPLANDDERESQMLAVDDGLVCDMTISDDATIMLRISDPIARTSRELPEPPTDLEPEDSIPIVVAAADAVARSFRVFLITDHDDPGGGIFMYESGADEWRALKSLPVQPGRRTAVSAVSLGGMLHVIFRFFPALKFLLLSYDVQEDVWKQHSVKIPKKKLRPPQLVVRRSRLFMTMWLAEQVEVHDLSNRGSSHRLVFEMREISPAEFSTRSVVRLTHEKLWQMFGEARADFDIAYAVPCFGPSGSCKSLVLVSFLSGKLVSYDLASESVVALPSHPAMPNAFEDDFNVPLIHYKGKFMNLSLRNLSSPLVS